MRISCWCVIQTETRRRRVVRRGVASSCRESDPSHHFVFFSPSKTKTLSVPFDASDGCLPTRKPVSCPFIAGTQPPSGFDGRGTRGGGGEPRSSRDIPRVRGARRPAASEGALVRRTRAKTRVNASGERFAMECFERKMSRIVAPRREPRTGMCVSFRRVVVKIVHHWLVLRHPQ